MIIRWIGAFGKADTGLAGAITWELTQRDRKLLCAERLRRGRSVIRHARVGLLVKNRAVVRRYRSDVWSVPAGADGSLLKKTRREGDAFSQHTECWVRPDYCALVVKGKVLPAAWQAVVDASRRHGIKLLYLTRDGRLVDADQINPPIRRRKARR